MLCMIYGIRGMDVLSAVKDARIAICIFLTVSVIVMVQTSIGRSRDLIIHCKKKEMVDTKFRVGN